MVRTRASTNSNSVPTTRSVTRGSRPRRNHASPGSRYLRELETDINYEPPSRQARETYRYNGVNYERQESDTYPDITVTRRTTHRTALPKIGSTQKRKRPVKSTKTTAASAPPPPTHPDPVLADGEDHDDDDDDDDERFRKRCRLEYQQQKPRKRTIHADNIAHILPFLDIMTPPPGERVQTHLVEDGADDGNGPVCHVLSSEDAKRLLSSNADLRALIFVADVSNDLFDEGSERRPIQQALEDWWVDSEEINLTNDSKEKAGSKPVNTTISDCRKHFLESSRPARYPWNIPDLPNPLAEQALPPFIRSLNCNFLRELLRRLLDCQDHEICQDSCQNRNASKPNACCDADLHRMTVSEYASINEGAQQWRSTVMIADAGATTPGHWDQYGFDTWIACHEGELGFCWQSHPESDEQRTQFQRNPIEPDGTYHYKVVRPGEVLYMPAGTVHHVFRLSLPEGKQTLCTAGHVIRRSAVDQWLHIMKLDYERAIEHQSADHLLIVPPIAKLMDRLFEQAQRRPRDIELFGGEERSARAMKLVKEILQMADNADSQTE